MFNKSIITAIAVTLTTSCIGMQKQRKHDRALRDYEALEAQAAQNREAERRAREQRQMDRESRFDDEKARREQIAEANEKKRLELRAAQAAALAQLKARRDKEKAELVARAKKLGYKGVIFDAGLTFNIRAVMDGSETLENLKDYLVQLDYEYDKEIIAFQVVDGDFALFRSPHLNGVVLILPKHTETVIQGAGITAMTASYFTISGTTKYKTLAGYRQAIVIEPAGL